MNIKRLAYSAIFFAAVFWLSGILLRASDKDRPFFAYDGSQSVSSLPLSSLDPLYPPKAEQPIYLIRMFNLGSRFTGIAVDLMEEDWPNLGASFEKFKNEYMSVSELVPEWKERYPVGPVEELGEALQAGEKGRIMAAYEKVGGDCHSCHIEFMNPVKFQYHWPDFRPIKVEDPITKAEVDFVQLMRYLDFNFTGMTHDLEQGQKERADENLRAFRARFQSLSEACQECHGTSERAYYTDNDIQKMMTGLSSVLASDRPDLQEITGYIRTIGMESCFKCHLVHLPAPYTKYQRRE